MHKKKENYNKKRREKNALLHSVINKKTKYLKYTSPQVFVKRHE